MKKFQTDQPINFRSNIMIPNQQENNTLPILEPVKTHFNEERAKRNIEVLRQFKEGNLTSLKQYSGFGGLRKAFKDEAIVNNLSTFLSPDEIDRLKKSTSTGYFTPPLIIDFIYAIIQKLGFTHGKILEPACGAGAFFERMPKAMRKNSQITGIELEPLGASIAKALYPDIKIVNKGFQHFHDNEFDLIIGNPPYASFTVFDKKHPDLCDEMIHHYFVAKSVRLLKENGLLAMVVPCYILDNPKRHLRKQISEVAELVSAYRLPENLFDDAKTTVDIVIFQRKSNPNTEWLNTSLIKLHDKKTSYLSDYFTKHPKHILGELSTYEAYSYFEDRPRRGLCCKGSIEMVQQRLPQLLNTV
ncbi:MAG: SAM-dependent DNA methyltransferase [Legionellales bacterium]|nr:SAM-dependent DNA methyltransferase [Legionellales bacterium]